MRFQSTKLIDGFSTCFRQVKAHPSHCALLHGYALCFKVTFEGPLDYRNWVVDFGFMKKSKTTIDGFTPDDWFKHMFDHTVLVDTIDPELSWFIKAAELKLMRLLVLPSGVGCEKFAEIVLKKLHAFIQEETRGQVQVYSVECIENYKNSAICLRH